MKLAPLLLGCTLCRRWDTGAVSRWVISEVEAYRGGEDAACHAPKGLTPRTRVMYEAGGKVYVYLIYGRYWMLNVVAGPRAAP